MYKIENENHLTLLSNLVYILPEFPPDIHFTQYNKNEAILYTLFATAIFYLIIFDIFPCHILYYTSDHYFFSDYPVLHSS